MAIRKLRMVGFLHASAFRFIGVGVVNTLLTIGLIILLTANGAPDAPSNFAGYVAGLICSFALNRRWSFKHDGPVTPALFRFFAVFGTAYLLNITIVLGLIQLGASPYLAHISGMPFYTLAFYAGCRWFVFEGALGEY